MKIWVDADATPRSVRDVLCRASQRRGVEICFVANQPLSLPRAGRVSMYTVGKGADVADDYIVEQSEDGHLVVSNDIPLAARLIPKGCLVLRPRGQEITEENVAEALSLRNFSESIRSEGGQTGGPPPLKQKDIQSFANALDRWLTRHGY